MFSGHSDLEFYPYQFPLIPHILLVGVYIITVQVQIKTQKHRHMHTDTHAYTDT